MLKNNYKYWLQVVFFSKKKAMCGSSVKSSTMNILHNRPVYLIGLKWKLDIHIRIFSVFDDVCEGLYF